MKTFDRMSLLIWILILAIIALHLGYLFHFGNSRLIWGFIHHTNFICGWLGSIVMLLSLLYIPRKRKLFTWGKLHSWYNFHVATGMLGPILIFFHSYGKYNGLGGLALTCMWIVFFTGVIGYYIYRSLNQEIEHKMRCREDVLRNLDAIEQKVAANSYAAATFKENLSCGSLTLPPRDQSSNQTVQDQDHRGPLQLWREFRRARLEYQTLKEKIVSQKRFEQRTAKQKKQILSELLRLENDTRNYLLMKEIFSLWRICHIPISWFMWILVTLHISAWLYY